MMTAPAPDPDELVGVEPEFGAKLRATLETRAACQDTPYALPFRFAAGDPSGELWTIQRVGGQMPNVGDTRAWYVWEVAVAPDRRRMVAGPAHIELETF